MRLEIFLVVFLGVSPAKVFAEPAELACGTCGFLARTCGNPRFCVFAGVLVAATGFFVFCVFFLRFLRLFSASPAGNIAGRPRVKPPIFRRIPERAGRPGRLESEGIRFKFSTTAKLDIRNNRRCDG